MSSSRWHGCAVPPPAVRGIGAKRGVGHSSARFTLLLDPLDSPTEMGYSYISFRLCVGTESIFALCSRELANEGLYSTVR